MAIDVVTLLNTIRANATPTYTERVPEATRTNITAVGNAVLDYSLVTNEFLTTLFNRIGMTVINSKIFKSPLAKFKQGGSPYGHCTQEIYINPAVGTTFNSASTDLLAQSKPVIGTAYHEVNLQNKYTVTLDKLMLKRAFVSIAAFDEFFTKCINSLYSGFNIDDYLTMKNLLNTAVSGGKVTKIELNPISSEATAKEFVTVARTLFLNFQSASASYNKYSTLVSGADDMVTWSDPEDIRLILRSDVGAFLDVNVLANAFNIDKSSLLGQSTFIDSFGTGGEKIIGFMFDKSFMACYDNEKQITDFPNPSNLTFNFYFHVFQTYSLSPFANAVAFVEPAV
jgi:hypothetical protein